MKEITIKNLQKGILKIDNTPNAIDKYFQKLVEEVGELSRATRLIGNSNFSSSNKY